MHNASGAGRSLMKEVSIDPHLFKPVISKRASSLNRSSPVDTNTRLYGSRAKNQELKRKEKEEAEKRNFDLCTFAPKLFRSRSASRENMTNKNIATVVDRLLKSGEIAKQKLELEKLIQKEKELKDVTFHPHVNKHLTSSKNEADVYTRLSIGAEKDISNLSTEANANLTFHPKITKRKQSSSDLSQSVEGVDETVYERLFKEAFKKREVFEEGQRILKLEREREYTFSPTIPERSSAQLDGDSVQREPIVDRLTASRQWMEDTLLKIKNDMEITGCTFQPELVSRGPKTSKRIDEGSVYDRLDHDSVNNKINAQRRGMEKIAAEIKGVTFKPKLPERKIKTSREGDTDDDVNNNDRQNVYDRLNTANIRSFPQSPAMSTRSSSVTRASSDEMNARFNADVKKRKENFKLQEELRAAEETKEETFSPTKNLKSSKITSKNKESLGETIFRLSSTPFDRTLRLTSTSGVKSLTSRRSHSMDPEGSGSLRRIADSRIIKKTADRVKEVIIKNAAPKKIMI